MKELKARALLHQTGSLALFAETTVKICGCGVGTEEATTVFVVREVTKKSSITNGRDTSMTTDEHLTTVANAALAMEIYLTKGGKLQ